MTEQVLPLWQRLIAGTVLGCVFFIGLGSCIFLAGLLFEGQASYMEELSSCLKRAQTAAEYHACR